MGMLLAADTFSRIAVRRKWVDIAGTERQLCFNTMYPTLYFVGTILKEHPGLYVDKCLVANTIGNKNFWEYARDYMEGSRIKMVKYNMLAGERWRNERKALIGQMVDEVIRDHFPLSWEKSMVAWVRHQFALLRTHEVVLSPRYWRSVCWFLTGRLLVLLKSRLRIRNFH